MAETRSFLNLVVTAIVTLSSLLVFPIVYRLWLHPLRRVPGPRLAAITTQWQVRKIRAGKPFLQDVHEKYGPVVRIGPNRISVSSEEGFNKIYNSTKAFQKSDWYKVASAGHSLSTMLGLTKRPDSLDLFTETDMNKYYAQQELLADVYSTTNVTKYREHVTEVLDRVCDRIKRLNGTKASLMEWMHIIVLECIGEVTFSEGPPKYLDEGSDFGVIEGTLWGRWQWWSVLGLYPRLAVLTQVWPSIFIPIATVFTGLSFPREKSPVPLIPWVVSRIQAMVQSSNEVKTAMPETNLINQLLNANKIDSDLKLDYIKNISRTNFLAGHATMTASVTGCVAGIASRRDLQSQFEIKCRKPEVALENLCQDPLVHASINEGLRLYAGTGANLDRRVPTGGISLHGFYIPGGTDIGTSSAILQTNKKIFGQDAAEFRPERWLSKESSQLSKLDTVNLIWGEPHRRCPGQNLALMLIEMIVPRLFREFDIQVQGPDNLLATAPPFFTTSITGYSVRFLPKSH
ncbi:hypothetical protein FPOAC1_002494 [Fusarium poae]|jgi:cytochrome P450|nr:hypothetical protein FPOAC1_002494 [Fusarium poae]KAG8676490.1 hypothetical protein FPOAC1_002494 [Fusarium poae]